MLISGLNLLEGFMKRMSDVFELPLHELDIAYCVNTSSEADALAAHAINHIDALADALEDLMGWHVKNVHVVHHPTFDSASKALKAYRGEA